jgi:hypothetical protein
VITTPSCDPDRCRFASNQHRPYGRPHEQLALGQLNEAIRIGDTVRRPAGRGTPAVSALLRHYEAAGFAGAARALGIDEKGEVLSFLEGEPAFAPDPAGDAVVEALGRLLPAAHDAQAGSSRRTALTGSDTSASRLTGSRSATSTSFGRA